MIKAEMLIRFLVVILLLCLSDTFGQKNKKPEKPAGDTHFIMKMKNKKQFHLPAVLQSTGDTLSHNYEFNTNIILEAQDIIAGWFIAPADLKIKAAGFDCGENSYGISAELKIIRTSIAWSIDMLSKPGAEQVGYWQTAAGEVFPFENSGPNEMNWIAAGGNACPFAGDIWSDDGLGAPVVPADDINRNTYQWIEMNILGNEPEIKKGEIFAICLKNSEPLGSVNSFSITAANDPGFGILKYYARNRNPEDTSTAGWWKREFMPNLAVAVELIGDFPPVITDIDVLETTLSTTDRKVSARLTDENPSGGPSGIQSAELEYSLNENGTWNKINMTSNSNNLFEGIIPGQTQGTKIAYRIRAVDVMGNETTSDEMIYLVFGPSPGVTSLLVLNGFDISTPEQALQYKYFGTDDFVDSTQYDWSHDTWAYGGLTQELADHYNNIFEIANSGGSGSGIVYNDQVIKSWLSGRSDRNYALAGQEWLGARYDFIDQDFQQGSFEYDVLGITHLYNDVSDTSDSGIPSLLQPLQGSLLCGDLFDRVSQLGVDSIRYDPYQEIGIGNWIDAFDVITGQDIDMEVVTRIINGLPEVKSYPCITHRILNTGNKIAFIGYDPLALNTGTGKYHNFGQSLSAPQIKILEWFDVVTEVKENAGNLSCNLYQNYPNPFNPETKITFTIKEPGLVSLKVYNSLGEEITTIVNEIKAPGTYTSVFTGDEHCSGIYYYVLKTSGFSLTGKMVLLR